MRALSSRAVGTMGINCTSSPLWWTMFGHPLSNILAMKHSRNSLAPHSFPLGAPAPQESCHVYCWVPWTGSPVYCFLFSPLLIALALYKPNTHVGLSQSAIKIMTYQSWGPWWINFLLHAQVNTVLSNLIHWTLNFNLSRALSSSFYLIFSLIVLWTGSEFSDPRRDYLVEI